MLSPKEIKKMDQTPLRTPVGLTEPLSENFSVSSIEEACVLAFLLLRTRKVNRQKHKYWIQPLSHREDFSKTAAEKCVYTEQITELDSLLVSLRVVSKVPDGVSKSWRLETPQTRSGRDTGVDFSLSTGGLTLLIEVSQWIETLKYEE